MTQIKYKIKCELCERYIENTKIKKYVFIYACTDKKECAQYMYRKKLVNENEQNYKNIQTNAIIKKILKKQFKTPEEEEIEHITEQIRQKTKK